MRILKVLVIVATAFNLALLPAARAARQAAAGPAAPKLSCAENQANAKAALTALHDAMEKQKAAKGEYPLEIQEITGKGSRRPMATPSSSQSRRRWFQRHGRGPGRHERRHVDRGPDRRDQAVRRQVRRRGACTAAYDRSCAAAQS